MASIPTLKDISVHKIIKNVKDKTELDDLLRMLVYQFVKYEVFTVRTDNVSFENYDKIIDKIVGDILHSDGIPPNVKIIISMEFLRFRQEVEIFVRELALMLCRPTKANIKYCIEKMYIKQNGEIDRGKTIMRILTHSQFRVTFEEISEFANVCYITFNQVEEFLKSEKYITSKSLIKQLALLAKYNSPKKYWRLKAMNYDFGPYCTNMNCHVFVNVVLHAPIQIVDYFYSNIDVKDGGRKRNRYLLKAFVTLLGLTKFRAIVHPSQRVDKIVFLQERIDMDIWFWVLKVYSKEIFSSMFISHRMDYCVPFYMQACQNIEPTDCISILKTMMVQIKCQLSKENIKELFYRKGLDILGKLWCCTPINVKRGKCVLDELKECLVWFDDKLGFHFLSIIITDSAFSLKQKTEMISFLVLEFVNDSKLDKVTDFLEELPENFNIEFVKNYISKAYIKEHIITNPFTHKYDLYSDFIFKSKQDVEDFKRECVQDVQFMIKAIASAAQIGDEEDIHNFLTWVFNGDKTLTQTFINEKLISENLLRDIYIEYLKVDKMSMPNSKLLKTFRVDTSQVSAIKLAALQDDELVFGNLDRIMGDPEITMFFECVVDNDDEKDLLVRRYLFSERGLNSVSNFFLHSKIQLAEIYYFDKLQQTIRNFCKFRKHWVNPFKLNTELTDFWISRSDDIAMKIKPTLNSRNIANANFKIFLSIIRNKQIAKYELIDRLDKSTYSKGTLKEFSESLASAAGLNNIPNLC